MSVIMLLLLVLSTAAIFCPASTQPARSDMFDENDYPIPIYRGEAVERPHKGIDTEAIGKRTPSSDQLFAKITKDKSNEHDLTKEKLFKREQVLNRLERRQFVVDPIGGGYLLRRESGSIPLTKKNFPLDPIGGGYLLRRESGSIPLAKKNFPLDPIGGGYLLKRSRDDQYSNIFEMTDENSEEKSRRSPGSRSDIFIRLIPKEDTDATLATDDSYLNNKNLHLIGTRMDSYPIDPIGGGLLLGRAVNYDNLKSKSNGKQQYVKYDIVRMLKDLEAMRLSSLYPQQGRVGKLVDLSGIPVFKTSKRMTGGEKRNFDEIDRSGFNSFIKKNFDEIDRSGFNSLVKKNFDEIDRTGFNGFVKRSVNGFESQNH